MNENIVNGEVIPPESVLIAEIKRLEVDPFYRDIRQQVEIKIPGLALGVPCTLKKICGKDFWNTLEGGEKNDAGKYMALLVTAEELPLTPEGTDGKNSCLYQRI